MLEMAALVAAVLAGVEPRRLGVLAIGLAAPPVLLGWAAVAAVRSRAGGPPHSAMFCEAVASELRAGASLRHALASSLGAMVSGGVGVMSELPLSRLAQVAGQQFPDIAAELGPTVESAAEAGASVADLFDEIGAIAIARHEIDSEIRVATAPARATAAVLIGAPVLFVLARLGNGGAKALLGLPQQHIAVTIGLGLFITGLAVAALILWRGR